MRILTLSLAVVAVLPALVAQRPLDTFSMIQSKAVVSAVISPDGSQVGYLLDTPRDPSIKDGTSWREVHVVPTAGGNSRGLLTGPFRAAHLGFSPDGARVTFTAKFGDDSSNRVYAIDLATEGAKPIALTRDGIDVIDYAMSSDGKSLAFSTRQKPDRSEQRFRGAGFDQIVYEEDDRRVELRILVGRGLKTVSLPGSLHEFRWSPNGYSMVLTLTPTPSVDDRYMKRDLYRFDTLTHEVTLLADVPGKLGNFAISPDGSRLAYIAGRDVHDPHESSLFVVGMEGGWSTSLTPADFEGEVNDVLWLDDATLFCQGTEGCHRTLFTQPAAGGNRAMWLEPGVAIVSSVSHGNGKFACVANTREHPDEVFSFEPGKGLSRLTSSNARFNGVSFGEQTVERYEARDGLAIEGILVKPIGYEAGKRYPLIVYVHGGPESCELDGWRTGYSNPAQVAAGRGFMVFSPNYRSSTGRGVAFSKAGQGDAAGPEFDDVLDGIAYLDAKGYIDPKRVGITGGSYGGYFSAWGATKHSEHFRAAVMFVGISNQLSKVGTTDIPNEAYYSHWKIRPWENVELLLERSPIMHTENARTPLLIMHGKDDPRVSVTQSIELYRWLKLRGNVPVRLVMYPNEGHGNRRRAHQLDYNLRMIRWFDQYLKTEVKELPPKLATQRSSGTPHPRFERPDAKR